MTRAIADDRGGHGAYSSGAYLYVLDRDAAGWRRRVDFLRRLPGLRHVEMWIEEMNLTEADLAALREAVAGWQVVIHAPHLQLSMISHHDLVRGAAAEIFRRTMIVAEALSAKVVTFHAGTRPFVVEEGLALDQIAAMVAALRATGSLAEPTLKNMIADRQRLALYPGSLEELQRVMDRIPDLRITLDVGHCVKNGDDWIKFLRAQAGRIANIHLHDADPTDPEAGMQKPLRVGGALDAFALARLLRAVGYGGFVTLSMMGQRDTSSSWALWQEAQAEAALETTATLEAAGPASAGRNGSGT